MRIGRRSFVRRSPKKHQHGAAPLPFDKAAVTPGLNPPLSTPPPPSPAAADRSTSAPRAPLPTPSLARQASTDQAPPSAPPPQPPLRQTFPPRRRSPHRQRTPRTPTRPVQQTQYVVPRTRNEGRRRRSRRSPKDSSPSLTPEGQTGRFDEIFASPRTMMAPPPPPPPTLTPPHPARPPQLMVGRASREEGWDRYRYRCRRCYCRRRRHRRRCHRWKRTTPEGALQRST